MSSPTTISFSAAIVQTGPFEFNVPKIPYSIPYSNQFFNVEILDDGGWNLHPVPGKIDAEMWGYLIDQANRHNHRCFQAQNHYNHHVELLHQQAQIHMELDNNFINACQLVSDATQDLNWNNFYIQEVVVIQNEKDDQIAETKPKNNKNEVNEDLAMSKDDRNVQMGNTKDEKIAEVPKTDKNDLDEDLKMKKDDRKSQVESKKEEKIAEVVKTNKNELNEDLKMKKDDKDDKKGEMIAENEEKEKSEDKITVKDESIFKKKTYPDKKKKAKKVTFAEELEQVFVQVT